MELKKASRKQLKLKVALNGSSGSGKTTSALLIAYGLTNSWDKIAVIDTENRSSELYVGMNVNNLTIGEFNTIQISKPYSPEKYVQALEMCIKENDIECIIIDSASHEWEGSGGVLDIHTTMTGNSFTNWGKLTPRHNKFIETIVNAPKHIIATFRSKSDYVMSEKNGKQVPEKVGLKAITREGVDYEFTLCFDIDIKHNAVASKDRTNLFMDKPDFTITTETGSILKNWSETGAEAINPLIEIDKIKGLLDDCKTLDQLGITWTALNPEQKNLVGILEHKDKLKTTLK
jgi:nucleoside-triphosphatase THEP1